MSVIQAKSLVSNTIEEFNVDRKAERGEQLNVAQLKATY